MEGLGELEMVLGAIAAGVVLNGLIVKLLLSGIQKRIDDLGLRVDRHEDACERRWAKHEGEHRRL